MPFHFLSASWCYQTERKFFVFPAHASMACAGIKDVQTRCALCVESGSFAAPEDRGACSPGAGRKAFSRSARMKGGEAYLFWDAFSFWRRNKNSFLLSLDKTRNIWYNRPREGVVSAHSVASQHPGRFGLACFKLRDSCMVAIHGVVFPAPIPSMATPCLDFFMIGGIYKWSSLALLFSAVLTAVHCWHLPQAFFSSVSF